MKIGAQLFTLRAFTKTLPELEQTLCRVAEMGYSSVQVSGTCPYTPEELLPMLKKAGLSCDLTHYNADRMVNEPQAVAEEHHRFECSAVGFGSMPGLWAKDADPMVIAPAFVKTVKSISPTYQKENIQLMYHNHAHEYFMKVGDMTVMEYLSSEIKKEEMGFTLDVYWVERGGFDPVAEIQRLKGRLSHVHLKDIDKETMQFAPVGQGTQNYPAILSALEDAGTRFAFVEQDDCYGKDPFLCLKESFDYLHSLGVC